MTAPTEAAGVAGALDMWPKAYAAFIGAFDTPHMRLKIDGDFAEDARHRLYQFNEVFATIQSRLLAADELREAIRWYLDHESYRGRHEPMQKALAAYDKAGGK